MTTFRHAVKDDGRVLVTVTAHDRPYSFHIPAAEAKRFAWSMLADLDEDGAEDAGYVAAPVARSTYGDPERDRAPWGSQLDSILAHLAGREASTVQIARALGLTREQVAVQCSRLKRREMVVCVRRGVCGVPAIWRLGPVTMEDWRLRHPVLSFHRRAA